MVNQDYKRQLTGRIANALVNRLGELNDQVAANDDLERLRRLHADGQIPIETLLKGLQVVKENIALPQTMRNETEQEINRLKGKFDVDLVKKGNGSSGVLNDTREVLDLEALEYRSTNVILPASTDIDSLPSRGWTRVKGGELADFLGQIGPVDGIIRTAPESTNCHWHLLPWYENVALIRLTDPTWIDKKLVLYYLTMNGNLFRLNGTSPPIHEINAKAPIKLSQENVADYLRFFCFFVRGEEGPFYFAEDVGDPFISHFESPDIQKILFNNVAPVTYGGKNQQGHFLMRGTVFYSNALFLSEFAVQPSGMIDMLEDTPVAEDLPERVDAPLRSRMVTNNN